MRNSTPSLFLFAVVFLTVVLVVPGIAAEPDSGTVTGEDVRAQWKSVAALVSEQKMKSALDLVGQIREHARAADDAENWTRALVEEVQLRTALHGYETAVRFLMKEPWPDDPTSRAVLNLFFANSLTTYAHVYSWEIRQRERIESTEEVDLKIWTLDQIVGRAHQAYNRVWRDRGTWGDAPLGSLARFIDQNTYPPRIRGTLRDAVSYMWVELSADSSLWTARQSNEIFRLDVAKLISGDHEHLAQTVLDDSDIHPLVKISAILDDLEQWHHAAGRLEAGLQARLERLQRLHAAFDSEDDKEANHRHLETVLDDFDPSYDWWSTGMAHLAEFIKTEPGADSLIRAREIARRGYDRHPESAGGQRCLHLIRTVEAPYYSLSGMAVDGPGRRSIRVHHKNLETIYLRAYRYDLLNRIESAEDSLLLPDRREVKKIISNSEPTAQWKVNLPTTPDFRQHVTDVIPPMTEAGAYVVIASARRDFETRENKRVALNFIVSDLVLMRRSLEDGFEITARSGFSGRALEDVEIRLYNYDWNRRHSMVLSQKTGQDGRAMFAYHGIERRQHFMLGIKGKQIALDHASLYPRRSSPPEERTAALIYTDRSVYRPQQTIHFKIVAYRGGGADSSFCTLPGTKVIVDLVDANHQKVMTRTVTTNDFGSASGEMEIPAGRLLGGWLLRTSIGGQAHLTVEEYKRPTFEVTVSDPEGPLRLNQRAELGGEVQYYFGLPVTDAAVSWRISREPLYPPRWFWWRPPSHSTPQVIASGETAVDAEGQFTIRFTPEVDERLADESELSFRFRLSVDVTDQGGETRSASRTFRLGFVSVQAKIDFESGFLRAGRKSTATVHRSDLNGTPRAGAGSWRLMSMAQPKSTLLPADQPIAAATANDKLYETPGDRLRPRWQPAYRPEAVIARWKDADELAGGLIEHDEDGAAEIVLEDLIAGAYRLIYTTEDDFGAICTTTREFIVAGDETTPLALPSLFLTDRKSAAVGESIFLLVHSGLADQEMVLEIFSEGRRRSRQVLRTGVDAELIEILVREADRGGFSITLTLVRDHQVMRHSHTVFVPWDNRQLTLELISFRDRLRPGQNETLRVKISGADGRSVDRGVAEVLAYMYDRSLDIFAPHKPPRPISLYPTRTAIVKPRSTLGAARPIWQDGALFASVPGYPTFTGDRLMRVDGYGVGGPGGRMRGYGIRHMKSGAPMPTSAMAEPSLAAIDAEEVLAEKVMKTAAPDDQEPPDDAGLRSDFSETAFFAPHLLTDDDGSVTVEFTVPDSVTEWNVWVHAITRDLRSGSLETQTRSVKDLMVRPYLPRFLREGDRATIKVIVNNAGETDLEGRVTIGIFDPDNGQDLGRVFGLDSITELPFSVESKGGTSVTFDIKTPSRVGSVAFKIMAVADDLADGEQRALPILPGRMHLVQSRFVALSDVDRRELHFADLAADDDPTRIDDQIVVSIDAQLFYSVLQALPYLVNYPYTSTEQNLNRFLSTGILTSLYDAYPAVARMAEKMSSRKTRLETWDSTDPNRRMALEETPWLIKAQGGDAMPDDLANVLDPRIATAERQAALAELKKSQTSLGAFPWWPGGPPSPYMTLYVVYGFSKGLEFGVEAPKDVVIRAWSYLHRHYVDKLARGMLSTDCCWETISFLNYVLSNYPDDSWTGGVFTGDDRQRMLDFSFSHWKQHSPLLKSYLSLTLERAGRHEDARLVFDSVMDSAHTDRDLGTYWAPEDRAWLWYNDTIETHALALRTLSEIDPADARRHGLVQWLLLNKKLNHWKSTRATAEVIYSLVHYLKNEGALALREEVTVSIGPRRKTFVFEPDAYTGKGARLIVKGDEIDPGTMSTVIVEKKSKGFAFASATWHFSTERLPPEARGDLFEVTRRYFRRVNRDDEWVLQPLEEGAKLAIGDQIEVQLSLRAAHAAEYVHLRDPRGAGFEPENLHSRYRWDLGIGCYEEVRDSGANFFFEWLPAGEYTFSYRLRANIAGRFMIGPAVLQSMYAPEFTAYSAGDRLEVE